MPPVDCWLLQSCSPVNLISGTTHKWIYVVMFGALSITVASTIFQLQSQFSVDFSFGNKFADVLAGGMCDCFVC